MNLWSGLLLASILVACAGGDDSGFPAERGSAGAAGSAAGSAGATSVAGESGTSGQSGSSAGVGGTGSGAAGADSGSGGAGASAGSGTGGAGGSGEGCDALAQTGCGGDKACYPETTGTRCLSPGAVKEGEACTYANACEPGLTCLTTSAGSLCRKLCDVNAATGCASNQACLQVKNQPYAICVAD